MSRKLIKTIANNAGDCAKVYRDAEWNEYRVVFYHAGVKQVDADYHTDDRTDAISTAEHEMQKRAKLESDPN